MMKNIITISEESIEEFQKTSAKTDDWMLYYFTLYIYLPTGEAIRSEAQIFVDIANLINAIDSLLLFKKGAVLFDSGGKYSIGFDVIDNFYVNLWVENGERKSFKIETSVLLRNMHDLLIKIRDICNMVEKPSEKLLENLRLINIYLHIIHLRIEDYRNQLV